MGLNAGTRLGPYEIQSALGAGGMGEVYRARDTKLGRDVALKILPEAFASDPERVARFAREARVLASLNHPHIAAIHGLEESSGVRALVMEFVDGPTLADRIAQGPIPIDDALPIARQICDALEAAHAQGIIHRDLKPANVKVRDDGTVKVLDFGLAKALEPVAPSFSSAPGAAEAARYDTITSPAITHAGVILGTAAYMAPEQARGKTVDKRADIWAFGCVLYEMLTGRRAFGGNETSDTLAEVIKSEPDWTALPATTPATVRRLLLRSLQKDRTRRLADIADARLEIDEAPADAPTPPVADASGPRRRERLAWVAAVTFVSLVAAGLAFILAGRQAPVTPEMRVDITTPPTTDPGSIALSPDGQTIAFVATDAGRPRLWLRSLDSVEARPLPRTEGAAVPFWAPHGNSIGFFADDGTLKRIDIDGGTVRVLANAQLQWGGSWNRDDTILFAPMTGAIFRVSAEGGEPTRVTTLGVQQSNHSSPRFLPDGEHFLYYVSGSPEVRGVYVAALAQPQQGRRLMDADSIAAGPALGHLLFVRDATLFAQPFDPSDLQLSGAAFPVADVEVQQSAAGSRDVALSATHEGRIAYRAGSAGQRREFVWFDRSGKEIGKVGGPDDGIPRSPSISTDHTRVVMHRVVNGNVDIWILETDRGALSRFTTHSANEIHPLWSPDGSRMLFTSNRSGSYALYEKSTTGSGDERLVLPTPNNPLDWSRDGRFVLLQRREQKTGGDIWALPVGTNPQPFPVVQTEFDERNGQFSPDGAWIAYESTESGRWEIYVQPFPGPGARVPVSINGGAQARWRPDGTELFYIGLDARLMAAPISFPPNGGAPEAGTPVPLYPTRVGGPIQASSRQQYFVASDGQRFLMNTVLDTGPSSPITLILNWKPPSK